MSKRKPAPRRQMSPASLANLKRGGQTTRPDLAVKHGAYARVTEAELEGKVAEVYRALGDDLPLREHDGSPPAADAVPLRLLAETLVRIERITAFVARRGFEDEHGKLRGVVEYELRLRGHALELAREMGMTPRARAALGVDVVRAASLHDTLADGREAWQAREARDRGQS